MKIRISISIFIAVLLLTLCACSDNPDDVRIGEPAKTAFFTIQVQEVLEGQDAPQVAELTVPLEGNGYVWVKISVTADVPISLYYDDFDLEIDGELRFAERCLSPRQLPENQQLQAGEKAEGYLVYLVPNTAKRLRLVYQEYYEGDRQGESYGVRLN